MQANNLAPDKYWTVCIYGSPLCVIVYTSYKLVLFYGLH